MNVSGILVVVPPARVEETLAALAGLPGVEVHYRDDPSGRVVVTQEAATVLAEVEGLKRIKALPHVTLAEMVYHYLEDNQQDAGTVPADLEHAALGTGPTRRPP